MPCEPDLTHQISFPPLHHHHNHQSQPSPPLPHHRSHPSSPSSPQPPIDVIPPPPHHHSNQSPPSPPLPPHCSHRSTSSLPLFHHRNHQTTIMENQASRVFYTASVTLRNRMVLANEIAKILTPAQKELFRSTCFGPWLKVQQGGAGDPLLTHIFLQTVTYELPEGIPHGDEEMWFDFPPSYTRFGREDFCLVTGLRFGRHDSFGPYIEHIPTPSWLFRVFPKHQNGPVRVEDLQEILDKGRLNGLDDIDFVRVCLLLLVEAGFMGKQTTGGKVWEQLSTHKNKSHMKYTLTGMFWAFKIFEAFPHMRTLAKKTSNDIPRAINWERKSQFKWSQLELCVSINDVADLPLQTLTPTEDEAATDWWQASKRFFDGVDDVDPPMFHTLYGGIDQVPPRHRDPSPLPFTHRADPPSSPPLFTHRANGVDFPLSPPHTRPTKMPRVDTSSVSPHSNIHSRHPQGDHVTSTDEIHALRDEVRALQEIVVPLQQEVRVVDVIITFLSKMPNKN